MTLKGHAGKVRSICWSNDDSRLVSVAFDGSVLEWDLKSQRRVAEHIHTSLYQAAMFGPDKTCFLGAEDGKIFELRDSQMVRDISLYTSISQMCIGRSGHLLVASTASGHVKAIRYPPGSGDSASLLASNTAITRLRMSYDEQYLFTCSHDGSLGIIRVVEKDAKATKRERGEAIHSDEILALRSDVKDQLKSTAELREKVEYIRNENERILEQRDFMYSQKAKETTDRFSRDIESLVADNEILHKEYDHNVREHGKRFSELVALNQKEKYDLELTTHFKMKVEEERYQNLQRSLEEKQSQWEKHMNLVRETLAEELEELRLFYTKKVRSKEDEVGNVCMKYSLFSSVLFNLHWGISINCFSLA
jgi:hypothetical protein